jgi:hypothetical protein
MKSIFWAAYCNKDHISAISEFQNIIGRYGYKLILISSQTGHSLWQLKLKDRILISCLQL